MDCNERHRFILPMGDGENKPDLCFIVAGAGTLPMIRLMEAQSGVFLDDGVGVNICWVTG